MKKWIMIPMLSGVLLVGNWASAQTPDATPVAPAAAVQAGGGDAQNASGNISGSGAVVGQAGGVPVSASAFPLPPPGANFIMRRTSNGAIPGGQPDGPRMMTFRGVTGAPPPCAVKIGSGNAGGPLWLSSGAATLAGKAEKMAFLGVATTRVTGTLRAQLKLKAGLVVDSVEAKSSAETAGLQVHDIVEKCDDQWLINPAQFIGLIRMHKPGETVTLTLLREGARKKITAKLEERMSYALDEDDGNFFFARQGIFDPNNPQGPVSAFAQPVPGAPGPVQRITVGALGAAPLVPGFVATFGDDKQELMISFHDGHQILTAKDPSGKQIFQGPIDTPEQRKLIPQGVRKEFDEMEKIRVRVHTQPVATPENGTP